MKSRLIVGLAAVIAVAWVGVVAMGAVSAWPHMPLDMARNDPAVAAAYQNAVRMHVLKAALAAAVPLLFLGIGLLLTRGRR